MKSKVKRMLIIFCDIKGVVHKESAHILLWCFMATEIVQKLQPKLCWQKNWLLHHENSRLTLPFFTRELLTWTLAPHCTFLCLHDWR
jgi:hypothetical protein